MTVINEEQRRLHQDCRGDPESVLVGVTAIEGAHERKHRREEQKYVPYLQAVAHPRAQA